MILLDWMFLIGQEDSILHFDWLGGSTRFIRLFIRNNTTKFYFILLFCAQNELLPFQKRFNFLLLLKIMINNKNPLIKEQVEPFKINKLKSLKVAK